jgi:L-seryl-tRNA(Ser) seleniumtransferase
MDPEDRQRYLRAIPAVDELLRDSKAQAFFNFHSKDLVVTSIRRVLEKKRQEILRSTKEEEAKAIRVDTESIFPEVADELAAAHRPSLRPVINATGVVLHTNLGRSPLSQEALGNVAKIAQQYSNLEFDVTVGERGSRYEHVEELLCRLTGAESALVVNNNAAAVLLSLNSLAEGKEVIVSRGQLVEIGGSFRIPDVMKKSGARLTEVGTTNRTHREDYEKAINNQTALLLKVHTSNFRILGFTAEVTLPELVALGRSNGLPVMEDLGSGCLLDLSRYGLDQEPTVQQSIATGADLITFSGDKLLGGPQAGIIVGGKNTIDRLKKNPLTRALRIDKLTLAGLEPTLRAYLNQEQAIRTIPVLRMLTVPVEILERRTKRFQRRLKKALPAAQVKLKEESSQVGGGALPLQELPTWVIALASPKISAAALAERLRKNDPPVIVRVKEEEVLLDLRTVEEKEENLILQSFFQILQKKEEAEK